MALAGALTLPAVFLLFQILRGRNRLLTFVSFVAFILLVAGLIGFSYACVRNALSFPEYGVAYADGSTDAALAAAQSLNNHTRRVVLLAGYAFVAGVALFSLATWRTKVMSAWLATIGLANAALFCFEFLVGFRLVRILVEHLGLSLPLWGIAPPPPSDYLFALWFIILGVNLLKHKGEGLGNGLF